MFALAKPTRAAALFGGLVLLAAAATHTTLAAPSPATANSNADILAGATLGSLVIDSGSGSDDVATADPAVAAAGIDATVRTDTDTAASTLAQLDFVANSQDATPGTDTATATATATTATAVTSAVASGPGVGTPPATAEYARYNPSRKVKKMHKHAFPEFGLQNLTRALRAKHERHHNRWHNKGAFTVTNWLWGSRRGHHGDDDDYSYFASDDDDAMPGTTADEDILTGYARAVYKSGPLCAVVFAFITLVLGVCLNCCGCVHAIKQRRRRWRQQREADEAAAAGIATSTGTGTDLPTTQCEERRRRCEECRDKCQARSHRRMERGTARWKLVVAIIAVMFVGSFILLHKAHIATESQTASFKAMQHSVHGVAAWADGVTARVGAIEAKVAAAGTIVQQGLDTCAATAATTAGAAIGKDARGPAAAPTPAAAPHARAALEEIQRSLASVSATVGTEGGSVGAVAASVVAATGDASDALHDALHTIKAKKRRHFWGGFFCVFLLVWVSLSVNLKSAFVERTRGRITLNYGVSFCRLFTVFIAFLSAAAMLFVIVVMSDFCFDARGNVLMLTTNGDGTANSNYDAFNYYLNCGGYDTAGRAGQYPFAAASASVATDLAHSRTALASIAADGTCIAAVAPELAALVAEIGTLTVGGTSAALLGAVGTAGGAGGALECSALNAKLEGMLATFCEELYTPFLRFWCFFVSVGVLLLASDLVQRCLYRARKPAQPVVAKVSPRTVVVNHAFGTAEHDSGAKVGTAADGLHFVPPAYDAKYSNKQITV